MIHTPKKKKKIDATRKIQERVNPINHIDQQTRNRER
jgi:hypothetical protein